jgi:signal transduction histidine kinase
MVPGAVATSEESARVAQARSRSLERLSRQRGTLRPLGLVIVVAVLIGSASSHPQPGLHGKALAVTISLCLFCGTLAFSVRDAFAGLGIELQVGVIAAMGAGGIALQALQPKAATGVAGAAAVWMAVARVPPPLGGALGGAITVGIGLASALSGNSAASVVATVLLCAVLGLVAYFIRQARDSQEQTEILMAQLEDARDEQTRAAAIAERGRIASELHDVLAHALSGAAIQLQGARKLAERSHAEPDVQGAIERASELVKDGLTSARQAVGALRGDALPTVAELGSLVDSYRADLNVDVTLTVHGDPRTLPSDASLALYRGAQEALTNIARYAPGASASVELSYEDGRTTLSVENSAPVAAPSLGDAGGGRGLDGMRERIQSAGGLASAGPTESGWRVELEVPA